MTTTALLVTRRPEWAAHGLATARRIATTVILGLHGWEGPEGDVTVHGDDLAALVNACLAASPTEAVIKVDDHDTYPDDHARHTEAWEPGATVWGTATWTTCEGRTLGRRETMAASILPATARLEPAADGTLTASLERQTRRLRAETGVEKRICPAEWSWGPAPARTCPHTRAGRV